MWNKSLFSTDKSDWETPDDLFEKLDTEFHFTLDVCANEYNTKCEYYYSEEQNSLLQEWVGVCWMNPPYGKGIDAWVRKAYQASIKNSATIVCLLPVRSDTKWWHRYCMLGEIRFLSRRLTFKGAGNKAPMPCAIVIFSKNARLGMNLSMII